MDEEAGENGGCNFEGVKWMKKQEEMADAILKG